MKIIFYDSHSLAVKFLKFSLLLICPMGLFVKLNKTMHMKFLHITDNISMSQAGFSSFFSSLSAFSS